MRTLQKMKKRDEKRAMQSDRQIDTLFKGLKGRVEENQIKKI